MNDIKKYLPSKKFIIISSSILLAIIIIFASKIIINSREANKEKISAQEQKQIALREQFLEIDSDNDNLKDWQESLWNTDPKNPDSDGDKTSDGDEITAYRDPLKAGPDDKFDEEEIAETKKIVEEYEALNETEKLSRTLFSQFIATQKIDSEMSETEISNLIAGSIGEIATSTEGKTHSVGELNIIDDSSPATLQKYKTFIETNVALIFLPQIPKDIETIKQAISSNNEYQIKTLDKSIANYKKIIPLVIKVEVPSDYADSHLVLLNSLEDLLNITMSLRVVFENPAISISAINLIPVSYSKLVTVIKSVDSI